MIGSVKILEQNETKFITPNPKTIWYKNDFLLSMKANYVLNLKRHPA